MTSITKKPKLLIVSQSIRQDNQAPLTYFKDFEIVHLYFDAPYGDMVQEDLKGARQVTPKNLFKEILFEKPDIIQGAEPFASRLALQICSKCLKASKVTGAKLVFPVFENRPIEQRFNLVQRAVLKTFCPGYFRHASAIFCLNQGAKQNVLYYFKKAKVVEGLVWGVWGVDMDVFRPTQNKKRGKIIYVGRLVEDKGLRFLLKAFALALKKLKYLNLEIVGGGELEGELKDFVSKNNLTDKVKFTGIMKSEALPDHFSSAELCVYPSITLRRWEEQVGTVNLQSLACGTPIITTNSGAIPEYITAGEGAILVKQRSAKQISDSIIKFFSNVKLKKTLTLGAREAVKKYDVKVQIAKIEKVLKTL